MTGITLNIYFTSFQGLVQHLVGFDETGEGVELLLFAGTHPRHLVIGGEVALVGFFYCQLDLGGQRFFVLDVVAKNVYRRVGRSLAVGFGQVCERVGQVFRQV